MLEHLAVEVSICSGVNPELMGSNEEPTLISNFNMTPGTDWACYDGAAFAIAYIQCTNFAPDNNSRIRAALDVEILALFILNHDSLAAPVKDRSLLIGIRRVGVC